MWPLSPQSVLRSPIAPCLRPFVAALAMFAIALSVRPMSEIQLPVPGQT